MITIDPRITKAFNATHDFNLEHTVLMFCVVGSESHGTYVPSTDPDAVDDKDFFGVVLPPISYTLGGKTFDNWTFKQDELDVVIYSFHKYVSLLLKGNPNVMGTLFMADRFRITPNEVDYSNPWKEIL